MTSAKKTATITASSEGDPLALNELFQGGGEPWKPLLAPTIESVKDAEIFIGPARSTKIVPVRELTFQALKPNPPERWKVVIFGQNPYPRVESATGIAMFDNTFNDWKDSQFGVVTSIRCIIKAACMHKLGIKKQTSTAEIRGLLAKHKIVQPPGWFSAMLSQGVLLLNAALSASSDEAISTSRHTAFWKPVVEKIIEEILRAKTQADSPHQGVVFAWWGSHARTLRTMVEKLQKKYPGVPVEHIDYCNPAAAGDAFCNGSPFGDINAALKKLGMDEVDFLPPAGWDEELHRDQETSGRMGEFIEKTMELHKFYLDRLQGAKDEKMEELPAISGVLDIPVPGFAEAIQPVVKLFSSLEGIVKASKDFAKKLVANNKANGLSEDEAAAIHLYTTGSVFYRQLNAAMRDKDRQKAKPYFGYLRLFFEACKKLKPHTDMLWRGVALDMRSQYPKGATITWWGVSSCTSKLSVAQGFLGSKGKRMLFEVQSQSAVGIKAFSAFTGEEEYVLAPGTRLNVVSVRNESDGLCVVRLEERSDERLVT